MWNKIKEYLIITAGVLCVIIGVYFFKFPNNFAIGGVTGVAMILAKVLPVSSATIVLIINVALLVVGAVVIGKDFGIKTVYGSLLLSFGLKALEWICPLEAPLTDEPVLELMFAVLLPAVGAAILFNNGGSTGGTDIVAMILKKVTSMDIGKSLLASDFILTLLVFPTFGIKTGLLSLLGLILKTTVIDNVIESMNLCKYMTIICEKSDEISDFIVKELHRGATTYKAEGAFTGKEKIVIMTVVSRAQAIRVRKFIKERDPHAFVFITNTSEIIGRGFRGV